MSRKKAGAPEGFELPDTVDLAAVNAAEIVVVRLAAQRRIDAREALYFSRMLEHRRRAIADATLEEKMTRIEELRKAQGREP
jgi:hypothetical protein